MTLIVQQIHIKVPHYKKKFIFFGYFLHNIINVIVEFFNICIRMSVSTATENILAFSILISIQIVSNSSSSIDKSSLTKGSRLDFVYKATPPAELLEC